MPDLFTIEKRSQVMSRIRGCGNKDTELALARLFRVHGITGWRRRQKHFGKPDFTFRRERDVVFVDGCFWHGCPKHSNLPVNNRPFWEKKLTGNLLRDRLVTRTLREQGWRVVRIWEHEIATKPGGCIGRIRAALGKRLAAKRRKIRKIGGRLNRRQRRERSFEEGD